MVGEAIEVSHVTMALRRYQLPLFLSRVAFLLQVSALYLIGSLGYGEGVNLRVVYLRRALLRLNNDKDLIQIQSLAKKFIQNFLAYTGVNDNKYSNLHFHLSTSLARDNNITPTLNDNTRIFPMRPLNTHERS